MCHEMSHALGERALRERATKSEKRKGRVQSTPTLAYFISLSRLAPTFFAPLFLCVALTHGALGRERVQEGRWERLGGGAAGALPGRLNPAHQEHCAETVREGEARQGKVRPHRGECMMGERVTVCVRQGHSGDNKTWERGRGGGGETDRQTGSRATIRKVQVGLG